MTWFKVDDKLHDHRKARKAGKAAMGVWVLAGSWSMDNDTDGFIPDDVLLRWGTAADARKLVAAGLWDRETLHGEDGHRFHDWSRFQPSAAVTAARRAAEAEAGLRGNHKRWHESRGITDPDCEYCYQVPDRGPDGVPDDLPESGGESGANRPVPVPDPVPHVSPNGETSSGLALVERDDVARLCDHLADRIAEDGSKRPTVSKGWHDAARLMLDKDGRTEADIHAAIDWCQDHAFWRANILSMPKLREKYDQLRKQAASEQAKGGGTASRQQETNDLFERAARRMGVTQ
jgi:hypothetical protein